MEADVNPIAVVFIITALTFIGCDRVLTHEPKASDLTGTYYLTADSEKFLINHKGYKSLPKSLIELRSDYSISVHALPDCATNGFGKSEGIFLTGDGKWRIEKDFNGYELTLDIHKGGSLEEGG